MLKNPEFEYLKETNKLYVYVYEWIDNFDFIKKVEKNLYPSDMYDLILKNFLEIGWEGDGELSEIWIPPFTLGYILGEEINKGFDLYQHGTKGLVVWHVKQKSDGLSFIGSVKKLSFEGYGIFDKNFDYNHPT